MKWLIDTIVTERNEIATGFPTLAEAAEELGHEVFQTKYIPFSKSPDPNIPWVDYNNDNVVVHGTHEFIRQLRNGPNTHSFLSYCREDQLCYSKYAVYLGDLMLNDEFVLIPYGEFLRRNDFKRNKNFKPHETVFVRPDHVTKAFTGRIIPADDFWHEVNALNQIERVDPESLIVVASPKDIIGEFRFVIANGVVVTGSEYRWDGRLDIRIDCDPRAIEVAQEVAQRDWQADSVYVCDVAIANIAGMEVARLIELNAFSCSGLYACDTRAIVSAVSAAALEELVL